nr:ribonuclease H-like domain-containing protein [Tanacetum cinerariifolium]
MDQQYPTVAKIPVLDTGKFEQWKFRIQQYLQHEHYALWEVIEFGDSKYKTTRELWAAILKTFGGNEATKKTKKNLLKQQYGNFKAEGSETLEQMFNRLQVIVEWLMHTIVWRIRGDLDTMSLDDLYNHLKVYELEVQKKSESNCQNMAFISSAKHSSGNKDGNTACVSTASTNVPTASASVATISQDTACAYITSQSSDKFWKKTGKKISIQGSDVAGFDKSKERGRRDNYRHGSKAEEQAPKALMAIDGVGWDWSYMANDEEDHALVADEVAPTEFALMANTNAESKVFDNSLCSKDCKKNNDSLNNKNKDGLGYSVVPPPPAQLYLSSKKDLSWTGLPKCADDTVTDYSRPSPTIESTSGDDQNRNPSVSENFVKPKDSQSKSKTGKTESPKKSPVKKRVKKSFTPKPIVHRPSRPSQRPVRTNMNSARPNRTTFNKQAHSYANRPFHRTSTVRSHYRAPWVPTVNKSFPHVNRKFSTGSRNFPTANRKFPTASRKFPTGSTKCSTADMGMKGKALKPSACNISYLSDYETFDGGYVSFGQGGCKITRKGTIKTECIVLRKDFKLLDDANILLRNPRQHNMYSIDLNNIVPHRDITCLVAKASADECIL